MCGAILHNFRLADAARKTDTLPPMQLILWRHAEAEDIAKDDLARALTPKGLRQADLMARWLRATIGPSIVDWRVLASPAVRTQQTAQALACTVETVHDIAPDAPASAVMRAAGWPGAPRPTIVVGHQPTLGMVAARLMHGADGYVSVKKGAIWWFETRVRDGVGQTVLKTMLTPDGLTNIAVD